MEFQYDAFFSYRHRPLDGEITQRAFNAVESYRLPRAIREQGCAEIRRAFRDTEELPVSRILTDTIDKALHSTNCLIVVCSTDTPTSEWIDREVQTFIEIGRADHIYPLLITGDPEHSFPPSLKLVPDAEDRMMDIRTPGNDVKKMMALAETELLRVISAIVGCKEKELLREHKLRKNRRFASRALGVAATFGVIAGVSLGLMRLAQDYRDQAQQREQASMRILSELTYDLPDHLTNVPGAYGRIADILQRNTEDIENILRLSKNRDSAQLEAAANYEKLANAGSVLGDFDAALQHEDQAISILQQLSDGGYAPGSEQLASAWNNRGSILNAAGRYSEAAAAYEQAITLEGALQEPDALQQAQMIYNAGANAVNRGDEAGAAAAFEESIRLLAGLPESADRLEASAKAQYNYALLHYRNGRYAEAEQLVSTAVDDYDRLLSLVDSLQNRGSLVHALSLRAACLTDMGRFDEGDACYEQAIASGEELAQDGENTEYSRMLADLYNNRALSANIRGRYEEAEGFYARAQEILLQISDKTGTAADQARYALALLNRGENAFKLGEQSRSRASFEAGLAAYEQALPELGDYDRSQYAAWKSYYELIHKRDYHAALETALAGCELQPNNVLANLNLAYACLYCGYREDAENLLTQIAALGGGMAETIRVDLEAQQKAGMEPERVDELMEMLGL